MKKGLIFGKYKIEMVEPLLAIFYFFTSIFFLIAVDTAFLIRGQNWCSNPRDIICIFMQVYSFAVLIFTLGLIFKIRGVRK